jgi:hypothetical protein
MVDEVLSRRSSFLPGREIRLADRHPWAFPAPTREWTLKTWPAAEEYSRLMHALIEVEDDSERGLAELAFAIFLLGQNYRLTPADYQQLLDFGPESAESIHCRTAFHEVTQEHLVFFANAGGFPLDAQVVSATHGKFSRLLAWFRTGISLRWRVFGSRSW